MIDLSSYWGQGVFVIIFNDFFFFKQWSGLVSPLLLLVIFDWFSNAARAVRETAKSSNMMWYRFFFFCVCVVNFLVRLHMWYCEHYLQLTASTEVLVDLRKQNTRFDVFCRFCDCLHKNDRRFKMLFIHFSYGPEHKQITKVWSSIFSTFLVMSAVQNETLKIPLCQSHGASPIYIGLASQSSWGLVEGHHVVSLSANRQKENKIDFLVCFYSGHMHGIYNQFIYLDDIMNYEDDMKETHRLAVFTNNFCWNVWKSWWSKMVIKFFWQSLSFSEFTLLCGVSIAKWHATGELGFSVKVC